VLLSTNLATNMSGRRWAEEDDNVCAGYSYEAQFMLNKGDA
jgi:hypothetical protein